MPEPLPPPQITPSPERIPTVPVEQAVADPARRVGRYVVTGELGRGGMGVVYRAWDPQLQRAVAIKMILDVAAAGSRLVERFGREARAAAKLRHPGIVAVHEVGSHGGRPYIVMDLVEGETLEAVRRRDALPPRRASALCHELALALAHAHDQGILHRDVKPANVIIDPAGKAHLTDFGLAQDLDRSEHLTASGQLIGTPSFLAPEQARGDHDAQGPATDVYAIGGVLYFALLARPPVTGDSLVAVINAVVHIAPTPPRQIDASIHPDLERIALRCLEKDPLARYPSAHTVAEDLERFLEGRAITVQRLGARERLARWAARNRVLLVAALAVLVTSLVLGIVLVARERDAAESIRTALETARRERADAVAASERAESERRRALESEAAAREATRRAERTLAAALTDRSRELADEGRPVEAAALAARAFTLSGKLESRSQLAVTLPLLPTVAWRRHGTPLRWLDADGWDVSPDLETFAIAGGRHVQLIDVRSGRLSVMIDAPEDIGALAFDATGERVITGGTQGLLLAWPLDGGDPVARWQPATRDGSIVAMALGADRLTVITRHGRLRIHDAGTLDPIEERPIDVGGRIFDATIALDGRRALLRVEDIDERIVIDATGHELTRLDAATDGMTERLRTAWLPDGRLAVADREGDGLVRVLDPETGFPAAPPIDPGAAVAQIAATDETAFVVTVAGDLLAFDLETGALLESPRAAVPFLPSAARVIAGGSALGLIRWASSEVWLADAATLAPVAATPALGSLGTRCPLAWSPDGLLATSSYAGHTSSIHILDGTTGETVRVISTDGEDGFPRSVASLSWAADGRLAAGMRIHGGGFGRTEWEIAVFDARKAGRIATPWSGPATNAPLAFSPDGSLLAAGLDGTLVIFDGATLEETRRIDDLEFSRQLAWDPTGTRIGMLTPNMSSTAWILVDVVNGRQVAEFSGQGQTVQSIAFSPDGTHVATGGPGDVCIWDPARERPIKRVSRESWASMSVSWDPTRPRVLASAGQSGVTVLDGPEGRRLAVPRPGHAVAVAFAPDGRLAAIVDGSLELLEPRLGQREAPRHPVRPRGSADAVAFGPASDRVARADGKKLRVEMLDGSRVADHELEEDIVGLDWSPDGAGLAVVGRSSLRVVDPTSGAPTATLRTELGSTSGSIAWSPDGRFVAADADAEVVVWNVEEGSHVTVEVTAHDAAVAWAPDGRLVIIDVYDQDRVVRVWDPTSGEAGPLGIDGTRSVAFGLAGEIYVPSGPGSPDIRITPPDGAERILSLPHPATSVVRVATSPVAPLLAAIHDDGRIVIWSLETDRALFEHPTGDGGSFDPELRWSPDGRWLLIRRERGGSLYLFDVAAMRLDEDPIGLERELLETFGVRSFELDVVSTPPVPLVPAGAGSRPGD